ncbi:hypothetical protein P5V15_013663 [Pogonomyrmex californicus]
MEQVDPEEHYYKLNRFLLSVSGLWPYQNEWSARLMRAIITFMMLTSTIFQLASMFTSDLTLDFIVDLIPLVLLTLGTLGNLFSRVLHIDKLRELFDNIWKDWALQKTHDEIKIMHERAKVTRLFTLCYFILIYISIGIYNVWMFVPEILNIISPLNESRPRRRPFQVEFFIDEERYFFLVRSHICLSIIIVPIVYLAGATLFLALAQHICGMCELLGYRAERLFCIKDEGCNLIKGSKVTRGNIAVLIRLHYNIIQFVDILQIYHTMPFVMDLIGTVILLSMTLSQILNISGIERAIRSIGIAVVSLCYIFIYNYMGQKVTDLTSDISNRMYNSRWYNAVVSDQKTLLIIMMRRCQPLFLTACKFYVMSLQNFGMILQTTISYCMFIRQI